MSLGTEIERGIATMRTSAVVVPASWGSMSKMLG
jgi:hypothetical protein